MEKNTAPRITKAQKFAMIAELPEVKSNPMLSEFIAHELELLANKNSGEKKLTAQQVANEAIKTAIVEAMVPGTAYTITDIIKSVSACADLTNQRVSALMRQLVEAKAVIRTEDKRKAYFQLA
jgi:hypothetical protein